jgi:hypothetical protein
MEESGDLRKRRGDRQVGEKRRVDRQVIEESGD